MEASHEEFVGSSNDNNNSQTHHMIAKGKRTKRHRPSSPLISSSSSSACGRGGGTEDGRGEECGNSFSSPTTSGSGGGGSGGEVYESTEEEEDMANCLIMLAQGNYRHHQPQQQQQQQETVEDQKLIANNASSNKSRFYVHECKTCNRTFPSFQALGGHRASHKKPKTAVAAAVVDDKKPVAVTEELEDNQEEHLFIFNKNLQKLGNCGTTATNKVHECSICGSEFTSGQALGGHMRRHRAVAAVPPNMNITTSSIAHPASVVPATKTKDNSASLCDDMEITRRKRPNILPLDLNLPAPEDDHRSGPEAKFALVFSAPALVDCHY